MRRPISYWRRGTLRWARRHPRRSSQRPRALLCTAALRRYLTGTRQPCRSS
ncbi:hypothetical protein LSCM4_03283 [Leishmania orientalis]|uniref:Uncharacterized protein n=1 Tax=Leishmania orientalis TaxID=2249476 RepID=A0A836H691_9TRYP|nr:hypothetical protein LSCM4_03283 [Leishmania orientalis]